MRIPYLIYLSALLIVCFVNADESDEVFDDDDNENDIWDLTSLFGNSEGTDSASRESRELPVAGWVSTTKKPTTKVPIKPTHPGTAKPTTKETPIVTSTTTAPEAVTPDSTKPVGVTEATTAGQGTTTEVTSAPDDTEKTPSPQGTCGSSEFMCRNGQCIQSQFRCDSFPDCTDNSDEENCRNDKSCPEGQFHCYDDTCVNPDAGCNGIIECPDGSDEDPLTCGVQISKCTANQPLDVVMVVHGSKQISIREYTSLKCGLVAFIESMKLADECIKMGMVHFSDKTYGQYALSNDTHELRVNVYNLPQLNVGTSTGDAVKSLRQMSLAQGRDGVTKVAVVVLYGQSLDTSETLRQAIEAGKNGIYLIAVGIGDDINDSELQAIAINGGKAHRVKNFEDFKNFVGETLVEDVCLEKAQLIVPSTKVPETTSTAAPTTTTRQPLQTVIHSERDKTSHKWLTTQYLPHPTSTAQPQAPVDDTTEVQLTKTTTGVLTTPKPSIPTRIPDVCQGCKMINGAGYNPHPSDCDKYVQCLFSETGSLVTAVYQNCPFGLFWNQDILGCDHSINVRCINDPCAHSTVRFGQYRNSDNCRAYWECSDGHSVPECCPPMYSYLKGVGCRFNPLCRKDCPPKSSNVIKKPSKCDKRSIPGKIAKFEQQVNGLWMEMPCALGTQFNQIECSCSSFGKIVKPPTKQHGCEPEIVLTFDDGVRDTSGKNVYVTNRGVRIENGKAIFDGRSRLMIQRFTNDNFGKTLVIRLKYRVENNFARNFRQALITNGDCGKDGSIVISKDRHQVHFGVKTDEMNHNVDVGIFKSTSDWKVVEYTLNDGKLEGSVNGVKLSRPAHGSVERQACALQVGQGFGLYNFMGEIDELKIYKCMPDTPYLG